MPEEIDFVHSLEHGRMEIQYSPELPEDDQLALKGLYDTMYGATLLFPNENMPYEVAATTWTQPARLPRSTRARSRSTRSAPSARRPGAVRRRAGQRLPLHRADPGRTDEARASSAAR